MSVILALIVTIYVDLLRQDSQESASEEGSEFNESSVDDDSDASEESGSDCGYLFLIRGEVA